ncbi:MAG TPA: hypothetical protein VHX36_12225 [Candidatus Acidoferrales bacterium]|jgi:hypothetical protein|nr:hypothetical protein [Candidatus Acidoferrales bacterium]
MAVIPRSPLSINRNSPHIYRGDFSAKSGQIFLIFLIKDIWERQGRGFLRCFAQLPIRVGQRVLRFLAFCQGIVRRLQVRHTNLIFPPWPFNLLPRDALNIPTQRRAMNKPNDTGPQTLEAGELVLRDASGRVGARLHVSPIGSELVLYGESGQRRAALNVVGEQPGLLLDDASGKTAASLTIGDDGPSIALLGTDGTLRATLMVRGDEPSLGLTDGSGTPRAVLSLNGDDPVLYLYDTKGKPRALLGVMFGDGVFHLTDARGKRSAALGYTRAETSLGYAALVCWAALLLLAPTIVRGQFGGPMGLLYGALALGGVLSTVFWVRYRLLWWKTKGRAMASYLADGDARHKTDAS